MEKYSAQLKSLELERRALVDADLSQIGADNPVIMAFLHRLYVDALEGVQEWLYKVQRAYNFAALNFTNIIGQKLDGWEGRQYNSTVLGQIYEDLTRKFKDHNEQVGSSPQRFGARKYALDKEDDIELLNDSEGEGKILRVEISPREPHHFQRMADVRITKVRLFLHGAKTDDGYLQVSLTHTGKETIFNTHNKPFTFTHKPVTVLFKYKLDTNDYTGPDTIDGTIASAMDDSYALVGPFTTWKIDISANDNPGLDLTSVGSGYLEFEGFCRARD